ncbi:hypothetical protein AFLA_008050 [Aspergillus flavus NRRL3357]|nr:hypothetical protein AFLA_008050 [Aspergillus flavus NRRL3357]
MRPSLTVRPDCQEPWPYSVGYNADSHPDAGKFSHNLRVSQVTSATLTRPRYAKEESQRIAPRTKMILKPMMMKKSGILEIPSPLSIDIPAHEFPPERNDSMYNGLDF